jgi:hypothetical protein
MPRPPTPNKSRSRAKQPTRCVRASITNFESPRRRSCAGGSGSVPRLDRARWPHSRAALRAPSADASDEASRCKRRLRCWGNGGIRRDPGRDGRTRRPRRPHSHLRAPQSADDPHSWRMTPTPSVVFAMRLPVVGKSLRRIPKNRLRKSRDEFPRKGCPYEGREDAMREGRSNHCDDDLERHGDDLPLLPRLQLGRGLRGRLDPLR